MTSEVQTKRQILIEKIGSVVTDHRPDMNYELSDEYIIQASLYVTAMLLDGMDWKQAIPVGFTAASMDFEASK
jgi:hypothetical protein